MYFSALFSPGNSKTISARNFQAGVLELVGATLCRTVTHALGEGLDTPEATKEFPLP